MKRLPSLALPLAAVSFACFALVACSASSQVDGTPSNLDSGSGDGGLNPIDTGGMGNETGPDPGLDGATPLDTGGTGGTSLVYAHTDTELYSLDPATKAVTKIGPFTGNTGSITDLAIAGDNSMFVNSTTEIYSATLPAGGTGNVVLTLKTTLPSGLKFYALGFTPAGVLGAGEALIAGDGNGDLYYVDTSAASTTPQKLGSFGAWQSGDPGPGRSGDQWTLSGDVVFYMDGAIPRGLATLRACFTSSTGKTKCQNTNDVLAEVDMDALKAAYASKSAAPTLRKRILGTSGSGFGRLFGIGAWEDKVYAFSRNETTTSPAVPAQLIVLDSTGVGTSAQSFPAITAGWSGAGVTTKAKISIIK